MAGTRSDLEVVLAGARAGSAGAFEHVYSELAPAVASYLRWHRVLDPEDLTNEIMAQVHRGLPTFQGDWAAFRSWVFTIAHRRVIDERRHRGRRPIEVHAEVRDLVAPQDGADAALEAMADERVRQLLHQLSPDQRDVLLLRIVADLSLEETAATLGKSVGSVKSLQHRGLGALRRLLTAEGVDR